jgi:hypothetical protein
MTHLTTDELIDAMEGLWSRERKAHLAECPECRRQLDDLSSVLAEAKQTSVPEPSPFYWNQLSTQVRAAVAADASANGWRSWLRWQVLLPLGGVAAMIVALLIGLPKREAIVVAPEEPVELEAAIASDASGDALELLLGEFDLDAAAEAGVIELGVADRAVLELTADEQAELTRLLQAELTRSKS